MAMVKRHPEHQEYHNPLRWGWYYVTQPDQSSGLMSKGAAKRYWRRHASDPLLAYSIQIRRHPHAPRNLLRYFTFPFPNKISKTG